MSQPPDSNVVFLHFKSPHVEDDMLCLSACGHCNNKTFTLTHDKVDTFPLMRCAACGNRIGRMGWAYDDDQPKPTG